MTKKVRVRPWNDTYSTIWIRRRRSDIFDVDSCLPQSPDGIRVYKDEFTPTGWGCTRNCVWVPNGYWIELLDIDLSIPQEVFKL